MPNLKHPKPNLVIFLQCSLFSEFDYDTTMCLLIGIAYLDYNQLENSLTFHL